MKKLIMAVFCAFAVFAAGAEQVMPNRQIANVQMLRNALRLRHDIRLGGMSAQDMQYLPINMKYLLTAVDLANEEINGYPATDFANSEYATRQAVNADTVVTAMEDLVGKVWPFAVTTVPDTNYFNFEISATGMFCVDWGDGTEEECWYHDTLDTQGYYHAYAQPGEYKIRLRGRATGYTAQDMALDKPATITFWWNNSLAKIDGNLAHIFPTLEDGTNPLFFFTFAFCDNLTGEIPENLFKGHTGSPSTAMFMGLFYGDHRLTGEIPENMFATFSGRTNWAAFAKVFAECSGLTGEIPENLFASIDSEPGNYTFMGTFLNCSGLTGSIPEKLFAGIKGEPDAGEMLFWETFAGCTNLSGEIPAGLFSGITGQPGYSMFEGTFAYCENLTGIGGPLFANMSGIPQDRAYYGTFESCVGLKGDIPDGMFGDLDCDDPSWDNAPKMQVEYCQVGTDAFYYTFYGCSGLDGHSATALAPDGNYYPLYDFNFAHDDWNFNGMYCGASSLEDEDEIPCGFSCGCDA